MTQDDYERMLAAQGGCCAICGRRPRAGKHLHVDHDHDTGRVRGLLCFSCNVAIGNLHHDVDRVLRAADYVDDDGARDELERLALERAHGLAGAGLV